MQTNDAYCCCSCTSASFGILWLCILSCHCERVVPPREFCYQYVSLAFGICGNYAKIATKNTWQIANTKTGQKCRAECKYMNIYYGFHAVYLIALKCVFTFERLSSLMLGYVIIANLSGNRWAFANNYEAISMRTHNLLFIECLID